MSSGAPALSAQAKVGLFTLAALGVLFWATFQIRAFRGAFQDGREYSAIVVTAHQLGPDSPVEVAGMRVGRVLGTELVAGGRAARISFTVDPEIGLWRDAHIRVRTVGLLGERYIDLDPGSAESGPLDAAADITDTEVPLSIEEVLADLAPIIRNTESITSQLRALVEDEAFRRGVPDTLTAFRHSAQTLEAMIAASEDEVAAFIAELHRVAKVLGDRTPDLFDQVGQSIAGTNAFIHDLGGTVTATVATVNRLGDRFDRAARDLEEILGKVNRGEGALGALISDPQTADQLKSVVAGMDSTLGRVARLRTIVDYLGTYQLGGRGGEGSGARHRAELRLQPGIDHYYSVAIVGRPEGSVSRQTRQVTRRDGAGNAVSAYSEETLVRDDNKVVFNAQIAKRFWDLTVRGGILENSGGVGLDYTFWHDRIWLRGEGLDFTRPGDRMLLRGWAEVRLFNHLTLAAGAEDIVGKVVGVRPAFGAGITFDDEDLKALFGSLPAVSF